jgi:hypothetical protein
MKRRTMCVLAALSIAGWWTFEPSTPEIEAVREFVDGSLPLGMSRDSVMFHLRSHGASYSNVPSDRCRGTATHRSLCDSTAVRASFVVGRGLCSWLGRDKVYAYLEFDETDRLISRRYEMGLHWPYDLC